MRFAPLAIAVLVASFAPILHAQNSGLASDEQILLKQVNTDAKALYATNLGLTEEESAKFWPIFNEYQAKKKPLQDRFLANVNHFAEKYDDMTDADAAGLLKEKMAIEKEAEALKQKYTAKMAKALPAKKALRYAQLESRVQNLVSRNIYTLIPLAR